MGVLPHEDFWPGSQNCSHKKLLFCNPLKSLLAWFILPAFSGCSVHSVKHCPLLETTDIFLAFAIKLIKAFPVTMHAITFFEQFQFYTGKTMLCREYNDLQISHSVWFVYSTVAYLQVSNVIGNMIFLNK